MTFSTKYPPPPPPINDIDYNFQPLQPIPPPEDYLDYTLPPLPSGGRPFTTEFPPPPSFLNKSFLDNMIHPDYIINLIIKLEYPDILNLCTTNKRISNLCLNNPIIKNYIITRSTEYENEQREYVNDFLKSINYSPDSFIHAIKIGDLKLINGLYKMGYHPSTGTKISESGVIGNKTNKPLIEAIKLQNLNVINHLLEYPEVDPTDHGKNEPSPFNIAIRIGNLNIIEILLQDPRINPSIQETRNIVSMFSDRKKGYDIINLIRNYRR